MRGIVRFLAGVMLSAALLLPVAANAQTLQTFAFPSGPSTDPAPQGARSFAGLIWESGFLYGTTSSGANIYTTSPNGCGWSNGCGTVFKLNPSTGKRTTIYKFCPTPSCPGGGHPLAGLVFTGGAFYGTAEGGGTGGPPGEGSGTVFKLTKPVSAGAPWTETAVYSFCMLNGCTDGATPLAGLVADKKGMLYGTTYGGGANSYGTVFELNPSTGVLTTLYSFCRLANCVDGDHPYGGVVIGKGNNLFGTTASGGNGNGSVFEINPATKKMTTIYSFPTVSCPPNNCYPFGQGPLAGLIADANETLYGTTSAGGANNYGVVFKLTPPITGSLWTPSVLYNFCSLNNCADGYDPVAGLAFDNTGLIYGTTEFGGAGPSYNAGTAFRLDPTSGLLTTLFSFYGVLQGKCPGPCFTAYANGSQPAAGLTVVSQDSGVVLYGTTSQGGTTAAKSSCTTDFSGCGTVFALTP
jgi:uncharacterized repeat protein (TIGR03803 family)